jgi:hypothetical protein
MPVHKNDAEILLLKTKNAIALYSRQSGLIVDIVGLFQPGIPGSPGTPDVDCAATIWVDKSDMINIDLTKVHPSILVAPSFEPDVWLNPASIVIGVGDMRDLSFQQIDVPIPATRDLFVIEYYDDYQVRIRFAGQVSLTTPEICPICCS